MNASEPELHLILGDGIIGQGVADELQRLGVAHRLASRSGPKRPADAGRHVRVDAADRQALTEATRGATHLHITLGVAYDSRSWERQWPVIIDNALAAARANGLRLVFFDNVYAYGPLPLQQPMTEQHPQQPATRKGRLRLKLSQRLTDEAARAGLSLVIGRCADFYGPGVTNSALYLAGIERQARGLAAQFIGNPDLPHSYTYAPDASRALVRLARDPAAYGRAWHLPTAGPAPTPRQLLEQAARGLGAPTRLQLMPMPVFHVLKWFMPVLRELEEMLYQQTSPYIFSSAAFEQRYPDFAVTSYTDGIEATVRALRPAGGGTPAG